MQSTSWFVRAAFVAALGSIATAQAKIPTLIVSGANNHDWEWTSPSLKTMLERTGRFDVDITYNPSKTLADGPALAIYRVIVLDYNGPRWGEQAEANFLNVVHDGVGVAVIHAANNAFPGWSEYETLVGDCWRDGTGHGAFHSFDLKVLDRTHPITAGLGEIAAHPDELYHRLVRTKGAHPTTLATAFSSPESGGTGADEPMILVGEYGKGRVFHTPLGHVWPNSPQTRVSFEDPQFQRLVARGVEWAATGSVAPSQEGHVAQGAPAAWTSLFDGKSTAAWRAYNGKEFPAQGWSIDNGALVCSSGGGDLISVEQFGDFELEFEWRVTAKANSGVMYRVVESPSDPTYFSGPEYQVLDNAYFDGKVDRMHSAGALYDICPAAEEAAPRPAGEFNQARIVVRGFDVEHYLNGRLVARTDFASPEGQAAVQRSKFAPMAQFMKNARGHIALQDHGDTVAYRNVRIRELTASTAIFNGKDLSGWKGYLGDGADPAGTWSVDGDGVLVCKGQPIGYLRTEADYTNYILDLDWRWSPNAKAGGNSGVLLRKIDEDKVWPKSLEAQLQDGSAGDFWVIEQFPCTMAPERTKGRNTKRFLDGVEKPLGEWNHYRITVDHGDVRLEVNGATVNTAREVLETPGKICLQSEGAEIHFRDVRITPLK